MGKSSCFYLSMDIYSYFYMSIGYKYYFYIFYVSRAKKNEVNICIPFYSRRNRARIVFYMPLIYLYREKKKAAKNGFSACYIELCINKKISLPKLTGNEKREGKREGLRRKQFQSLVQQDISANNVFHLVLAVGCRHPRRFGMIREI